MNDSEHIGKTEGEFNVCQFFKTGEYEYVRRRVNSREAMEALGHYTRSVAARHGIVVRVIITDAGDETNAEWKFGVGFTYPPELVALAKQKEAE